MYVQFGCHFCAPAEWINFDASPTLRFERVPWIGATYTRNASRFPANVRYGDIVKGLPIASASCSGIYCSHVIEHLSYRDARVALRRVLVYLMPAGIFRVVVPDLEALAREYLASGADDAAGQFMERSGLGRRARERSAAEFARELLGNSAHLWMWDEKSLSRELHEAGFRDVRRAEYGDCVDPMFKLVEDRSRFDGCLALECRR